MTKMSQEVEMLMNRKNKTQIALKVLLMTSPNDEIVMTFPNVEIESTDGGQVLKECVLQRAKRVSLSSIPLPLKHITSLTHYKKPTTPIIVICVVHCTSPPLSIVAPSFLQTTLNSN
jgi:hypothetical protein